MEEVLTHLKDLDIGDLRVIHILNCPVPVNPFADLLTIMGIQDVTILSVLKFSQAQQSETVLQGYHFKNLSGLLQLELPRNNIKSLNKLLFTELSSLRSLDLTNNGGIQIEPHHYFYKDHQTD